MTVKKQSPHKLHGSEVFKNTGRKSFSVKDFWQYAFSNLNSNIIRGTLAEFIVENALKEKSKVNIRNPWSDYDILTDDSLKIEVKCCSYIQDWEQKKLSTPVFTGLKARYVSGEKANYYKKEAKKRYKADIYVLALLKHKDPETLDLLDLNQWCFYVLTQKQIADISNNGNSVSLAKLKKNNIEPVHFNQIKDVINFFYLLLTSQQCLQQGKDEKLSNY